jgi:hypothetical protein
MNDPMPFEGKYAGGGTDVGRSCATSTCVRFSQCGPAGSEFFQTASSTSGVPVRRPMFDAWRTGDDSAYRHFAGAVLALDGGRGRTETSPFPA